MSIRFDETLGLHERALSLHMQRSEILASNLANADTPGYKARDIDFRDALKAASVQGQSTLGLWQTSAAHQAGAGVTESGVNLKYRVPTQPSLDGNTVESHIEQAAFAENSIRYQATLTFLKGRFDTLKMALQGGQ